MPRIKNKFLILTLFLTGCFQEKSADSHGLSMMPKSQFSYRGLVDRSLKLKFKLDKADETQIIAVLETDSDYNFPLKFEWKLGEFVTTMDTLKGQIPGLKKNSPLEIKIKVRGFNSDQNRFVRFEALGSEPSKRIFADGIVGSQMENSFEKIVQEIELYKKSQDGQ